MPLQRSFSDQNHSAKKRSKWHRNKSFHGQQATKVNTTPKVQSREPLLPVSSATKNKLNGFQFTETIPNPGVNKLHPGKENVIPDDPHKGNKRDVPESAAAQPEDSKRGDIPSTPSGKLALPDLIEMGDVRRAVQNISPNERVLWNDGKEGLPPSVTSCGTTRRVRKRARSSSPISSSPAHISNQIISKADLLNQQTDPGSELWGRYSLNGSKASTPSSLVHIMHTSSPQPSKESMTSRSTNGFRRAISCGNHFPKRRKRAELEPGLGDDVFSESSRPSKLSVLIERVQEGFSQSRQPTVSSQQPSSSPISKEVRLLNNDHETSPTPLRECALKKLPAETDHLENQTEASETGNNPLIHAVLLKPDVLDDNEFDDDDLDASLLDTFTTESENIIYAKASPVTMLDSGRINPDSNMMKGEVEDPIQTANAKHGFPPKVTAEFDEFDDLDEEMLSADLESIVAKFDKQDGIKQESMAKSDTGTGHLHVETNGIDKKEDSDDEYGHEFDDLDFEAIKAVGTQPLKISAGGLLPAVRKARTIQRYLVTNVLDSEYEDTNGRLHPEKVLLLQVKDTTPIRTVYLRGIWIDSPVTTKAYVHIIGNFDSQGKCIIDDNHNLLILHPDHLISSTQLADSFGCTRRAVLQDRVKATSESSPPLVYGTILHEIFQAAMLANRWDLAWLTQTIEEIALRHVEDLYTIKLQIPQAVEYLRSKMGELQAWAELFVSSQPKEGAIVKAGNGEKATMCVSKLLDVEEHVWSPMYGLKGNIDATVQVTMRDGKRERTLTVPFEVKTGKNPTAAHRAQTALYNLLLSDRYDIEIAYGILYYMETSETIRIPTIRHELRHMIMQRNELACFVRERHAQLPQMLKKENMCGRCYAKVPCFIYHKLADDGTGETSGMKGKFDEVVKHLTPKHKEFFLKWDDLLTKEEKESLKFRRELWTMVSSEREKRGRCFSNVIIEPGSAYEEIDNPKINRYRYTLVKKDPSNTLSFLDSQILVGEPIVISDEKGHFALAKGYVTQVRKNRITVAVDRRLHNARIRGPKFDEVDNQVFASIMEVAPEGSTVEQSQGKIVEGPMEYRLDKDEFSNGMATARNNLIQIMADGPFGSQKIRNLVVDLVEPRFKVNSTAYTVDRDAHLNVDQRRALDKVMTAEDYALVLGMPGTGKTTTIAHIIRALVSQKKSVLLTSYTHTAVDNILLKLRDDQIPILRLGTAAKVSPEVQEFSILAGTPKSSFEEIEAAWHETPIVATTCLGINHPIFNERTFDYCIVDEASQITLPVCLGPIRLARTFILVGDHYQLPPLVANDEAKKGGLDVSLFKLLSDSHPNSVVYLEHQYRMCSEVMTLSNNLIYNGRLKCGSQEVAESCIRIPNMDGLRHHHFAQSTLSYSTKSPCAGPVRGNCWIRDLLDPEIKVAFINTDTLLPASREEEAKGNRIVNHTEAAICTQLVESLLSVGMPSNAIGVMTHYRSQLALLKHGLRNHSDVEMHTADRFQGRDKEVVILSLVRSNESKSIGELLKDWRRINVAFTRAKTKLLVIGSKETLLGNGHSEEMVAKFVRLMEEKGWVYALPRYAIESHVFDEMATQVTASISSRPATTQSHPLKEKTAKREYSLENSPRVGQHHPKRIRAGEKALLSGRPVLRDIINEMMY
ncbi:hypothetical protein B7463_g965, partial [Scytalidium lignicola]